MKTLINFINEALNSKNDIYNDIIYFIEESLVEYKSLVDELFYYLSWDDKYEFIKSFCEEHDYFENENEESELKNNLDSHIDNIREIFGDEQIFEAYFDYFNNDDIYDFWDNYKRTYNLDEE